MSNPQSPAPGTPSTVRGDAVLDVVALGVEESSDRCCTCHRGIDHENSIVIVRASSKSREIRRCRKCHNLRSAINRLSDKHGSLVKEWSKVDAGLVEAFFYDHPDLRGENLRQKLEQTVMDWKTKTTRMEFNQESTYMDEVDLKKKYESRPELLAAILENAHRFFCPVKKVLLYADPEYKGRVSDVTENGTTEKRKCATGLLDTEEQNKKKRGKNGKPTEPGKDDKPKLKAGEKKKMTKKVEVLTAKKLQLNDLISKAGGYGDMIPAYVRTHAQEAVDTVDAGIRNAQNIIDDNKGDVKNMMEELDKVLESGAGAADRLKAQLEAAAAFNV